MLGWEYPPHHSGGLGVACKGMAHALVDNNVHVCFMLPRTVKLEEKKIKIAFADSTTPGTAVLTPHLETLEREIQNPYLSHTEYEKKLRLFIKAGGKIVPRTLMEQVDHYGLMVSRLLRSEDSDYDVIHAHDWLCYPAGIAAKEITGKPLVVHVHATEFDRCGGDNVNQAVYERERHGMHMADHVIAISERIKRIVIDKYGVDPNKVTVIYNGSDVPGNHPNSRFKNLYKLREEGKKVVLFAGRITIQKGVDYFVHAAKKVLEYEKGVYFIVAGSGDMEQQIIQLTADLGISQHFLFTGYYKVEEQTDLFAAADLVVMPSVSEPFGIIPLESMNTGTPVIVSKQSGVSEIISHALKADFWDTDKMADQIIAVLRNPSLYETLRKEGQVQASGLTWDKPAKAMKALYQLVS
jgi:glycosyltransferase involved in cell wall biosynthesis